MARDPEGTFSTQPEAAGSSGDSSGYGGRPPVVGLGMEFEGNSEDDELTTPVQRLGQRLEAARLARSNMPSGAAAKTRFDAAYIRAVMRGQIRPSLGALAKMAETSGVPLTDLLTQYNSARQSAPELPNEEKK